MSEYDWKLKLKTMMESGERKNTLVNNSFLKRMKKLYSKNMNYVF